MKSIAMRAAWAAMVALYVPLAPAANTFFGEDLNGDPGVALSALPISSAAQAAFAAGLSGAGTETFESRTAGEGAPLSLTFPGTGGTFGASLAGGNGVVGSVTPGSTDGFGRYGVPSATSSRFWQVSVTDGTAPLGVADVTLTFDRDVAAIGFFAVDAGDFGGSLSLQLLDATSAVLLTFAIGNDTTSASDGSVLFFGLVAAGTGELFRSVRLTSTGGSGSLDAVALDNLTLADACQAGIGCGAPGDTSVPSPGTAGLLAAALAAFVLAGRRAGPRARRGR